MKPKSRKAPKEKATTTKAATKPKATTKAAGKAKAPSKRKVLADHDDNAEDNGGETSGIMEIDNEDDMAAAPAAEVPSGNRQKKTASEMYQKVRDLNFVEERGFILTTRFS